VNRLLAVSRDLQQAMNALPEFADIERAVMPRTDVLPGEFQDTMDYCRRTRQDSLALVCLLTVNREGFLPRLDLESLARLSMNFGLYNRVITCCGRLRGFSLTAEETFNLNLLEAKALRGLGRYAEARSVYRDQLKRQPGELDQIRLLLNLAKVSHTSEWRIGYYQEMTNTLIGRLRGLLSVAQERDTLMRLRSWLGVCLDSSAKVSLETALVGGRSDGEATRQPLAMLHEAAAISREDDQRGSLQRRLLRECYFRFQLATSEEERHAFAREFAQTLEELGDENDPRGLGVRYGQLMEMQTRLGLLDQAQESAGYALRFARRVSDWRALARNYLRQARLTIVRGQPFAQFEQEIELARTAVARLGHQHPEVEIDIERELASQLQSRRELQRSHATLQRITAILDRQERRVLADFENHSRPESEYCPAERGVLGTTEWGRLTAALVLDYRMLSKQLRDTLEQMSRLAAWSAREQGVEAQLWFLGDYMASVWHRSKNVVNMLGTDAIIGVLRGVAATDKDGAVSKAVTILEGQLGSIAELQHQAEHDLSLIRDSEVGFVSISEAAGALDLDLERSLDPDLKLVVPAIGQDEDFALLTHEPLLKQVLTHLIENAARAVREGQAALREVIVRVGVRTDSNGGRWGTLEVEDTGGGAHLLQAALHRIAGEKAGSAPRSRLSGLYLAHKYFQAFKARFAVSEPSTGRTCVSISFPHDEVHCLIGRRRADG
jgi:tetratricopeptide (TPR) repeat protein